MVNKASEVKNSDEKKMDDSQEDVSSNDKKARGKNKNYFSLCSFRDFSGADKALKEIFDNQKWRKGNIKGGDKRYYSCNTNGVKSDCPVRMYLFMHSDSQICTVYMSTDEHNHQGLDVEADSNRLSAQIKEEIIQIYENETHQTSLIIEKLREKNFKASKIQIYNLIHRYKINQIESKNTTLNQLKDYCIQHKNLPDDLDQVYIPQTSFQFGLNVIDEFRIFLTTKRLVNVASNAKYLFVDVTYKLLWHDLPVIIIGTIDFMNNLHPFGLTICKNQHEKDFIFTFEAIKTELKLLKKKNFEPNALISDINPAIAEAFENVFGKKFQHVANWYYVLKRIDLKLNKIKDTKIRKLIREDILNIQSHSEIHNFKSVAACALNKWKNYQLDSVELFINFFKENFIDKNCSWYESFSAEIPKTNNTSELIDSLVKEENSFRKQLPVNEFLNMVSVKLLKKWSSERAESHNSPILFKSSVEPIMENWNSAWEWELLNKNLDILQNKKEECSRYYIPSGRLARNNFDDELIKNYENSIKEADILDFDKWIGLITSIWTVCFNNEDYKKSICSCPYWKKNKICKHVIAIACRANKLEWNPNARDAPLVDKIKKEENNSINSPWSILAIDHSVSREISNNQENHVSPFKQKKRGRPSKSKNAGDYLVLSSSFPKKIKNF